jgi:hypothetical protein
VINQNKWGESYSNEVAKSDSALMEFSGTVEHNRQK